ncbi:MAG: hypothetical protein OEM96_11190, partial [Gemmatimonadota bacterium]|nr:hypothetical protein [Gemmatimonadota bacterium]
FHANTYMFQPDDIDGFRFEYSTDGNTFTPLVDLPVGYGTLTASIPPIVNGTVYIRLIDTDRTIGNYQTDGVSVDFMSIDAFVAMPPQPCGAVVGLEFDNAATMSWSLALGATHYDIMRGSIDGLHVNASVGDASCTQSALPSTAWTDPEVPPSGQGFYYIIRGQAATLAPGTFDNPGPPPLGWEQRDEEVGTGGGIACPGP